MTALRMTVLASTLLAAGQAAAQTVRLAEGAERFAGMDVVLDERLRARACATPGGYSFAWAGFDGRAVEARCAANGERLVLPLAARELEPQRLKRGTSVQAEARGSGFRLSVTALAESAGRDGHVVLRNSRSGQRFAAKMDPAGRIIVSNSEN
jgi:hypothetical protein